MAILIEGFRSSTEVGLYAIRKNSFERRPQLTISHWPCSCWLCEWLICVWWLGFKSLILITLTFYHLASIIWCFDRRSQVQYVGASHHEQLTFVFLHALPDISLPTWGHLVCVGFGIELVCFVVLKLLLFETLILQVLQNLKIHCALLNIRPIWLDLQVLVPVERRIIMKLIIVLQKHVELVIIALAVWIAFAGCTLRGIRAVIHVIFWVLFLLAVDALQQHVLVECAVLFFVSFIRLNHDIAIFVNCEFAIWLRGTLFLIFFSSIIFCCLQILQTLWVVLVIRGQAREHLCFDITIQLIFWWFVPRWHVAHTSASPRWSYFILCLFIFFYRFQTISVFVFLSACEIIIELSRSIKHLFIHFAFHLVDVLAWIYHSVAAEKWLFHRVSIIIMILPFLLFLFLAEFLYFACKDSPLKLHFLLVYIVPFFLHWHIQQSDCIFHQFGLYRQIESALRCQTRCVIDFYQPGFQLIIDHDIKA